MNKAEPTTISDYCKIFGQKPVEAKTYVYCQECERLKSIIARAAEVNCDTRVAEILNQVKGE